MYKWCLVGFFRVFSRGSYWIWSFGYVALRFRKGCISARVELNTDSKSTL